MRVELAYGGVGGPDNGTISKKGIDATGEKMFFGADLQKQEA